MTSKVDNDRAGIEAQRRFGQAVSARRTQLSLSQEQFAERVCVDRTYVSKIERGLAFPTRPIALAIAALTHTGGEELMALWGDVEHRRRQLISDSRTRESDKVIDDFAAFMGNEIARDEVCLVYPVFRLAAEVRQRLDGLNPQLLYEKEQTPFTGKIYRIDVPVAVAANDVSALLYISELLARYLPVRIQICTDIDVTRNCACSFFSFGLSSNDCTHMYLATTERPLFAIVEDTKGSEFLRLADGKEFRSSDREQYGIILRVKPDPSDHPDRMWFLCAGLGPHATPGAAWYLASHWQSLHERVGSADFVAVIKVGCHSDKSAKFEHLLTLDAL